MIEFCSEFNLITLVKTLAFGVKYKLFATVHETFASKGSNLISLLISIRVVCYLLSDSSLKNHFYTLCVTSLILHEVRDICLDVYPWLLSSA